MKSLTIFVFIIFLSVSIYFAFSLKKREKIKLNRESAWPEVLDLIISALQSGASISESLSNLGRVGPNAIKNAFKKFEEDVLSGKKFDDCLTNLKKEFADPISDQLFECLYFAAKFGSKNTVKVLRELSEYVSADLAVRAEITTRFGWVRNSANLAALAPWILFLILPQLPLKINRYLRRQLPMIYPLAHTLAKCDPLWQYCECVGLGWHLKLFFGLAVE